MAGASRSCWFGPRRPHQAEADEEEGAADAGEDACESQTHGQRLCGDGADAELADQTVRGAAPGLLAGNALDRVLAVEVGPVLAVDLELVGAGLEGLTVVLDVLGQRHGLHAVQHVVGDGRHLVHVLARGVHQRVGGVELGLDDRVLPVVLEQAT